MQKIYLLLVFFDDLANTFTRGDYRLMYFIESDRLDLKEISTDILVWQISNDEIVSACDLSYYQDLFDNEDGFAAKYPTQETLKERLVSAYDQLVTLKFL